MKYPKVIGVYFGDNDFVSTAYGFLRAIGWNGIDQYEFTKEKFVELWNKSIIGFYWTYQNLLQYRTSEPDEIHTKNYLQITEKKVYFDEEVGQLLTENKGWCNSEFFIIDTSAHDRKPYVYSA